MRRVTCGLRAQRGAPGQVEHVHDGGTGDVAPLHHGPGRLATGVTALYCTAAAAIRAAHPVHVPGEKVDEERVGEALYGHWRGEDDVVAAVVEHGVVGADGVRYEEKGAEKSGAEAEEEEPVLEGYCLMLAVVEDAHELHL
jgi:hypothetical protein